MTKKYIELILNNKIEHLGKPKTIIKVAAGYARNYLVPTQQASIITKSKLKQIENLERKKILQQKTEQKKFLLLKSILEKVHKFTIKRKSNITGQIFGSVSEKDISQIIYSVIGQQFDKNCIILPEIKYIGHYTINIVLTETIKVDIQLQILPDINH
uniref:50S ribosomal protein L9, chloroplastic n=1 Tax=Kumanoa americana TaxID=1196377 RepID=A0A1C9CGU6_9FLOR|nr:ribosomal protein L9 [Kumanoa americana]AOM67589.1 ribosomal protein L9 [Kumanoa americana]